MLRNPSQLLTASSREPNQGEGFVLPDEVDIDLSWKPSDGFGKSDEHAGSNEDELNSLTVPELKDILRKKGFKLSGNKAELIERIENVDTRATHPSEVTRNGLKIDLNWKPAEVGGESAGGEINEINTDSDDMEARLSAAARFESKSGGSKKAFDGLSDDEGHRRSSDYKVVLRHDQCAGCGVKLQFKDSTLPGYLPDHVYGQKVDNGRESQAGKEEKEEEEAGSLEREGDKDDEDVICQRCHRLRNYGVVAEGLRPGWSAHESLNPSFFNELIAQVRNKRCVVVTLIDVFDFHGSILPDLATLTGRNPLFVAVNKVDLLPSDYKPVRVKQWVLEECRHFAGLDRLRVHDVHLISAKSGQGVGQLLDAARSLARERGCNLYVVGAANVGKSSLLNKLSNKDGGQAFGGGATRGGKKKRMDGRNVQKKKKRGITTSALPGTTLNFLRMEVGDGVALFDTPGLILSHQLTSKLSSEELKQVIPSSKLNSVALRLTEGKSVMLGALARVEFTQGRPFFLTFFNAPGVTLHSTSLSGRDADAFMAKHSGGILKPPMSQERAEALQEEFVSHVIHASGRGWVEASCDVVLSGLGWFSFTGVGDCTVTVYAPKGVMVLQRDALMPYEARDAMGKSTGGRIVQRRPGSKGSPRNPMR